MPLPTGGCDCHECRAYWAARANPRGIPRDEARHVLDAAASLRGWLHTIEAREAPTSELYAAALTVNAHLSALLREAARATNDMTRPADASADLTARLRAMETTP